MKNEYEISYRESVWQLLLRIVIGTAMTGVAVYLAATGEREFRLFRIIGLPPEWTAIVLWGIAALFGAFTALLVVDLVSGTTSRTYHIRLTSSDLTAPKGFVMKKPLTVPLADIRKLRLEKAGFSHSLRIKTGRGTITINRSDIGQAAFDELGASLALRLRALGIPY